MRRVVAIFAILYYFSCFSVAKAGLLISEIMYNPKGSDEGREWIEVYNDSTASIDLTRYKLFENDTNHKIIAQSIGELSAGQYAILSKNPEQFLSEFKMYSGAIFKSSFSLKNTGESIALKDESGEVVDVLHYDARHGGSEDDKSIQKINSIFIPAFPTPGLPNKADPPKTKEHVPVKFRAKGVEEKSPSKIPPSSDKIVATEEVGGVKELPNLGAQTIASDSNFPFGNYGVISVVGLFFVMCVGIILVRILRKKRLDTETGDDFEIYEP